jgi:hypothetical protein
MKWVSTIPSAGTPAAWSAGLVRDKIPQIIRDKGLGSMPSLPDLS